MLLLLLLSASLLSGCGGSVDPDKPKDSAIPLTDYLLIRSDTSDTTVLKNVLSIKNAVESRFGGTMLSKTDWSADIESGEKSRNEILVGNTDRPESKKAYDELKGKTGYILRSDNDQIVIAASTKKLLSKAVEVFILNYIDRAKDGYLPSDFNMVNYDASLCVLGETNRELTLVIPKNASDAVSLAAERLAMRIETLFGIAPSVQKTGGFSDTVVVKCSSVSTQLVKKVLDSKNSWKICTDGEVLTILGTGDIELISAMATLDRLLAETVDYNFDDLPLMFFDRALVLNNLWDHTFPDVIGGAYVGTEAISALDTCSYFEKVSAEEYKFWQDLLMKTGKFTTLAVSQNGDGFSVRNNALGKDLIITYDLSNELLTVTEKVNN